MEEPRAGLVSALLMVSAFLFILVHVGRASFVIKRAKFAVVKWTSGSDSVREEVSEGSL